MKYSPILLLTVGLLVAQARAADLPPIRELKGLTPQETVFDKATATKPLTLTSEKDAGEFFTKDDLAKLTKVVDFAKQIVLIFAWSGSGGDRLSYTVADSLPEQVAFKLTRGLTRDLRPHVYIYILRSDVKWTAQ